MGPLRPADDDPVDGGVPRHRSRRADRRPVRLRGGRIASTFSASDARGPNRAVILGTEGRIEIDPVWYSNASFRVVSHDDAVLEEFHTEVNGRGMHYQAAALEQLVADGRLDGGDVLSTEESVAIMGTLDRIPRRDRPAVPRRGVSFPQTVPDRPPPPTTTSSA